jgi:hypothetical protein
MRHVPMSLGETLVLWWRTAVCKVLGHAPRSCYPFADVCSKCRGVLPPERRTP